MTDDPLKQWENAIGAYGLERVTFSVPTAHLRFMLDRIEALTAERDEAINQLDSAIHSVEVLKKRVAAVMEDRRFILEERDRTFAVMLARAERAEAEADNARLREALSGLLADIQDYQRVNNLGGEDNHWQVIARAALKGESHD